MMITRYFFGIEGAFFTVVFIVVLIVGWKEYGASILVGMMLLGLLGLLGLGMVWRAIKGVKDEADTEPIEDHPAVWRQPFSPTTPLVNHCLNQTF